MKPFLQLVPGRDMNRFAEDDGPVPGVGDCWRAAIGCVLEINPRDVPHFAELPRAEWWQATLEWLGKRGLSLIEYDLAEDKSWAPPVFCLLSGPSPRGEWDHTVVGHGTEDGFAEVVHDPHPSADGLRDGKWRCAVFVATDPAHVAKKVRP